MTRHCALLLVAVAAVGPADAQAPDPSHPKIVMRVSREFVESLTRGSFDTINPLPSTTQKGATLNGTIRAAGSYKVSFNKSPNEASFDLHVDGTVDTDMGVTRRPLYVQLDGHAPLCANRRVTFDGTRYTAGPVGVQATYRSTLDGIDTLRRGPLAPVLRRVARPVVLRALPEADEKAGSEVRAKAREKVIEQTDEVVETLNRVHAMRADLAKNLSDRKLGPAEDRVALATTDDAIFVGTGFPVGVSPTVPATTDGPPAPIEIWLYHPLSPEVRTALARLKPDAEKAWDEKVKPQLVAQLGRHAPELARRVERASHDVKLDASTPGWHRVRFFQEFHTAAPPAA